MPPAPSRAALILATGIAATATLGFAMAGGPAPVPAVAAAHLEPKGIPGALLLLHTGEQRGHLEPCGCTTPQIGGLPRRSAFLASLPHDPVPVVVDDGDLVADPGRQSQLKAEALAGFFRANGYAAVNLGEQDFHLGFGYLRALQAEAKVPFLSANVRLGDRPAMTETASAPGVTLVGLLAASFGADVKRWNPMLHVEAPEAALARLEPSLKGAGRVVLLFHGAPEEARPLARRFPWLAAIVTAHEADDYRPEALMEAGVPMVNAGRWGKVVGRLQLGPDGARQLPPLTLGPEWSDAASARTLMSRYLSRVNAEGLLDHLPRLPDPEGHSYAGTAACQSCHAAAYTAWKHSGHAHAYPTLVTAGHDRDPDCVGCHVVGLGSQSGFRSLAATPHLTDVGCESCHGAAAAHAQSPAAQKMPPVDAATCRRCHVAEQSPHFDFTAYWAKIRH
jgi:2',3'-cyclic-nucleotide 2'-phosphodiesterase (5'-nucleotidase family)